MTGAAEASSRPGAGPAASWTAQAAGWLRAGRGGMFLLALLIGAGSGLGAVAFRYLIYFFTWLATGMMSSASRAGWPARICRGWARRSSWSSR